MAPLRDYTEPPIQCFPDQIAARLTFMCSHLAIKKVKGIARKRVVQGAELHIAMGLGQNEQALSHCHTQPQQLTIRYKMLFNGLFLVSQDSSAHAIC